MILILSGTDIRTLVLIQLVLIPKHLGDFTDFFVIFPLIKLNLTTVSSAQMGEILETPMFVSASQNTTLEKPIWC